MSNGSFTFGPKTSRDLTIPARLARALLIPMVLALASVLVAAGLYPVFAGAGMAVKRFDHQLESGANKVIKLPALPQRSTIYDASGRVLATLFLDENRKVVSLDQVAWVARRAVIDIEDHKFYEHGAVDGASIIRAAIANLRAGRTVQGASTITQQLVKNTTDQRQRTLSRKFREAQDAIALERRYTKQRILEAYLNTIFFGHRVYGIATASEYYFDRNVSKLSVAQAALLAGMIQSPVAYDPIEHSDAAKARRDEVLADMLKYGHITTAEYEEALGTPIKLSSKARTANTAGPEPYWVSFVVNEFEHDKKFGKTVAERRRLLFQGGLKIYTTLQPNLQRAARTVMKNHLPKAGPQPPADPEAAVVSIVPQTGAIEAMVGGTNYSKQQIDLASQGSRSTGSAFKAFTLVAALEQGVPPGRVYSSKSPASIPQCPDNGGPWMPFNAEGAGNGGFIDLWQATAGSINVVFAQLIADIGPESVQKAARQMGLTGYIPDVCAITLGAVSVSPLSMTTAYSTLANGGKHCQDYSIAKVVSSTGERIYKAKPKCKQVVPPDVAATVTAMLQGVISHGTGGAAQIGRPEAGKTGTGQDFQDAWFMGYIPQLCTGVWVGYSKGEIPMRSLRVLGGGEAFGGSIAAPIWHDFMVQAVVGLPVLDFPTPPPQPGGTVPSVVGLKQQAAEDTLTAANFVPFPHTVDSSKPAGTVVDQSPPGGASAPLGSGVTIDVSNGQAPAPSPTPSTTPTSFTVPDVTGETQAQATTDLKAKGFAVSVTVVDVHDQSKDGIVVGQSPKGGAEAKKGDTVTITVGKFVH